jgi:hypothetical protein
MTLYAFWPNNEHTKAKEKNKVTKIEGEIGVLKSKILAVTQNSKT